MSVEFQTVCAVGSQEIPVTIYYTDEDPACLSFRFFNVGDDSSPEWVFGRDLLKEALDTGNSGEGDVRVEVEDDTVMFWLKSPTGLGLAVFEREIIDEFIEFVYDEIPEGEDNYDVPDEIPEEWLV
jgi:hypothetical protein